MNRQRLVKHSDVTAEVVGTSQSRDESHISRSNASVIDFTE